MHQAMPARADRIGPALRSARFKVLAGGEDRRVRQRHRPLPTSDPAKPSRRPELLPARRRLHPEGAGDGRCELLHRAAEALRKSLAIAPGQSGALRHLAYVLYSLHDFEGAAAQAARAIELNPTDGHAHGILGDAYLEVGQYARAEEAYRRMLQTDGDLYSYSRLAGLKSLRGDVDGAIADLEGAIEAGTAKRRPAESRGVGPVAAWQRSTGASGICEQPKRRTSRR